MGLTPLFSLATSTLTSWPALCLNRLTVLVGVRLLPLSGIPIPKPPGQAGHPNLNCLMSKSIKPAKIVKPVSPNFAKLGDEFLQASRFIDEGFKGVPKWPTYHAAFKALENFLKAYLLLTGATLEHVHYELGNKLGDALSEAKAKGLVLKVDPSVENVVMKVSDYYTEGQPHYSTSGEWSWVLPHLVIRFVDQVQRDAGL